MTNDEAIKRASRARQILDDAIFKEAAEHIEAECFRKFKELAPTDVDGLAQVKGIQYMHAKYMAFLNSAVADGKMAQLDVERKRKPTLMERFKQF